MTTSIAMKVGMLWYDDNPRTELDEKVRCAARYFRKKHGYLPTRCFVHLDMLPKGKFVQVDNISVTWNKSALLHHFWLGIPAETRRHVRVA